VAGQVDVSRQLFDRALPDFDTVLVRDLGAALGAKVDEEIVNRSGSGGHTLGLLNVTDIGAQTYTDESPTVDELLSKTAGAFADVAANSSRTQSSCTRAGGRGPWRPDSSGVQIKPEFPAEVVMTAGVPTDLGGGTEDAIIVLDRSETRLFMSRPTFHVMPDVVSGNLAVRVQARCYCAPLANRQPASISAVTGKRGIGAAGLLGPNAAGSHRHRFGYGRSTV
jgi:hypothetical protein